MGFVKSSLRTGIALKAFDLLRREAAKPQNQAKAKELLRKMSNRRGAGRS
jgi:hypothetical protein